MNEPAVPTPPVVTDEVLPLTVFVHIPKTAGTLFTNFFRRQFPSRAMGRAGNVFQSVGTTSNVAFTRAPRLVADPTILALRGHLPRSVGRVLRGRSITWLTVLREPVDRFLSQWDHIRFEAERDGTPAPESLADALADRSRVFDNLQTRMLSGASDPFGPVSEEMFSNARKNLREMFVGIAEQMPATLALARRELGWIGPVDRKVRATAGRRPLADVPSDELRLAREANRFDIRLYADAVKIFTKRVSAQDVLFPLEVQAVALAGQDVPLGGQTAVATPAVAILATAFRSEEAAADAASALDKAVERIARLEARVRDQQAMIERITAVTAPNVARSIRKSTGGVD